MSAAPVAPAARPLSLSGAGWLLALLGWTCLVAFYRLDADVAFDPPDAWVAQTAREMSQSPDWRGYIVPAFSGETRLQKSPGPYWAVCFTSALRGTSVDTVAARTQSAVAAVVLVLTIFWLTWRIAGERAAIFAGFATAASALMFYWSHRSASDLGLTALMTLSLTCLWVGSEVHPPGRRRVLLWLAGYLTAGLAMLYKMPMPLVCVGLPAVLYVVLCRRWRLLASPWHLLGLALFLLPWLPWVVAVLRVEPDAWFKWKAEFFDRFTGDLPSVTEQRTEWRVYFLYLGVAAAFCLPWTLSMPGAIARGFRRSLGVSDRGRWFLLVWFFGLLAFFTVATGKESRYFVPGLPPLFALLGIELARFFDPGRRASPRRDQIALVAVALASTAGVVIGGYQLHRLCAKARRENWGVWDWDEVRAPFIVLGAILVIGLTVSAWLYAARRENASFGALVATMWAAFFWGWPTLMPIMATPAPWRDLGQQLAALAPEHRAALRQIAQQDARIIWYGDLRFPRLIDQFELLRMQGNRRSNEREVRIVGEELVRRLEASDLLLAVCEPQDYARFQIEAAVELARNGRTMPANYVWLVGRLGHAGQRHIVFGNQPPPWPPPALPGDMEARIRARRERELNALPAATQPAAPAGQRE